MLFQDLAIGQSLSLEMVWENTKYNLDAITVGKNNTGVLIAPLENQDDTILVIRQRIRHLTFSIYTINENGDRISWKNVKVYPMTYKDRIYFACGTNLFNSKAESSERRNDKRVGLDINGEIQYGEGKVEGLIHDVSDSGISFEVDSDVVFDNTRVYVGFKDVINENDFSICEVARIVRNCPNGDKTLYGCRLMNPSKDYLTYMYFKRMSLRANVKKDNDDNQGETDE